MNIDKLRDQLKVDEGVVYEVYKDHLGYPTFGIGHLVREDVEIVIGDCKKLYRNFDKLPEEVQQIVANMMFNMGLTRLSKFKGMKAAVMKKNWQKAADEMVDSRWYRQVPKRADRLVERMREV